MEARELRIGNYIQHFDNIIKVDTIKKDPAYYLVYGYFLNGHTSAGNQIDAFTPIPLTKEWLLKFGFKKREGNNFCWDLGSFTIGWYGNCYATWVIILQQENNDLRFHSQIKFIHQLQNLYFALTGEELIIK
jgi:hypothetical protein